MTGAEARDMRRTIAARSSAGYKSSTAVAVAAGNALMMAAAVCGGSFCSAPRTCAGANVTTERKEERGA